MKLFYLTGSDLKSMPANAVHSIYMAKAFKANSCSIKYFVRTKSNYYPQGLVWPSYIIFLYIIIYRLFYFKDKIFVHSRDRSKLAVILAIFGLKVGIEFHNLKKLNRFECLILSYLSKKGFLKLFFTSKTLYNMFILNNFKKSKIPFTLLKNAAPCNFIKQDQNKIKLQKNLSFVMVSSKRKGKGQEKIYQLSKIYPQYNFTIVGPALFEIKDSTNLNIIGKINNKDVLNHLQNADIFLSLIYKKMEVAGGRFEDGDLACPLKIFEYLALAKPIIMSKRTAMMELFSSLPGVWFVNDDLSDFSLILNKIIKLKEHELKKIQISHKKFINKNNWERRAKLVLTTLKK